MNAAGLIIATVALGYVLLAIAARWPRPREDGYRRRILRELERKQYRK